MEQLIEYLLQEGKRHKNLVESIPVLQKLSNLPNQTKELQGIKDGLTNDLEALRKAYKDQEVQNTLLKQTAISDLARASQEASGIRKSAEAQAKVITDTAQTISADMISKATDTKQKFDIAISNAQKDLKVLDDEIINQSNRLENIKNEILRIKNL